MSFFNPEDKIALLATPEVGLTIAALFIAFLSLFFYWRIKRSWIKGDNLRSWAFWAELLTAVGIVGLITFVGRARLDHLDFQAAVSQARERNALVELNKKFLDESCNYFGDRAPKLLNGKHEDACSFSAQFDKQMNPNVYWKGFRSDLKELAGTKLSNEDAKTLIKQVTAFENARTVRARAEGDRQLLAYDGPWKSLLICFLLSAIGISIKCVRAFIEWKIPKP
jgi:amino acid transporter